MADRMAEAIRAEIAWVESQFAGAWIGSELMDLRAILREYDNKSLTARPKRKHPCTDS